MLEKFLNQEGTKKLTKEEKKNIEGGTGRCPGNQVYAHGQCWDKYPD